MEVTSYLLVIQVRYGGMAAKCLDGTDARNGLLGEISTTGQMLE